MESGLTSVAVALLTMGWSNPGTATYLLVLGFELQGCTGSVNKALSVVRLVAHPPKINFKVRFICVFRSLLLWLMLLYSIFFNMLIFNINIGSSCLEQLCWLHPQGLGRPSGQSCSAPMWRCSSQQAGLQTSRILTSTFINTCPPASPALGTCSCTCGEYQGS